MLPHRAAAKIDLRLVPDMKFADAVAALKAHLANHGFGDIEVNVTGGYDPTSTAASAPLIQAQVAVLKRGGIDPVMWLRNAGSYPGYVFTGPPQPRGRPLGTGSREWRPRARRVLRRRVHQPEDSGVRWRGDVVRGIPL